MWRAVVIFLVGGILGTAFGVAVGFFAFPYVFPPPEAMEQLSAEEQGALLATAKIVQGAFILVGKIAISLGGIGKLGLAAVVGDGQRLQHGRLCRGREIGIVRVPAAQANLGQIGWLGVGAFVGTLQDRHLGRRHQRLLLGQPLA